MILLHKNTKSLIKRLQSGGQAPAPMSSGAGVTPVDVDKGYNDYVNIDVLHPSMLDASGNSGRGSRRINPYGRAASTRGSGKDGMDSPKKTGGFLSDQLYAQQKLDEINTEMAKKTAADPNYVGSDEYKADLSVFEAATRRVASAAELRKNYEVKVKGKDLDDGALAIDGDRAFVKDQLDPNAGPKIVSLSKDIIPNVDENGVSRYQILSIGSAQTIRDSDINYTGYEQPGQNLEEIIKNSYNQENLNKMLNAEFKTAGITDNGTMDILLSDGTNVNVYDLFGYLGGNLDVQSKSTISTTESSNKDQLDRASKSILSMVEGNQGMYNSLRNMALGNMYRDSEVMKEISGSSPEEVREMMGNYVQNFIANKARQFIKTEFKENAEFTKASGGGDDFDDKSNRYSNSAITNLMDVGNAHELSMGHYGQYSEVITGVKGIVLDESQKILHQPYLAEHTKEDEEKKTLLNNMDINGPLVDLSLGAENTFTMVNGVPLAEVDEGEGLKKAVPYGSEINVHYKVPVTIDKETGAIRIADKEAQILEEFKSVVNQMAETVQGPDKKLSAEEWENLSKSVYNQWMKDPERAQKFKAAKAKLESGEVFFKDMVSFKVLLPANKETWVFGVGKDDKYDDVLLDADKGEYENLNADGIDFGEGVYETMVFAPLNDVMGLTHLMSIEGRKVNSGEFRGAALSEEYQDKQSQSEEQKFWGVLKALP